MKTTHQTSHQADASASAKGTKKERKEMKQREAAPKKRHCPDLAPLAPKPAFHTFPLLNERHGERKRDRMKFISHTKLAPNSAHEMDVLYLEGIGQASDLKLEFICNRTGQEVFRGDYHPAAPEEAAQELLMLARNACYYLEMLVEMNPGLCRRIAATESHWPVVIDLTEEQWQRPMAGMISKLELGKDIKGHLLADQTSGRNLIRHWAAAIYRTLLHTRLDFKEALEKPCPYRTTEGCPDWARKTLRLPKFTKASAREWARVGEEMLLQQMPGFLEHPDFIAKKRSWTHRASKKQKADKASLRAIQREAFEDFAKELKNIAPEREIWEGEW